MSESRTIAELIPLIPDADDRAEAESLAARLGEDGEDTLALLCKIGWLLQTVTY